MTGYVYPEGLSTHYILEGTNTSEIPGGKEDPEMPD